MATARRLQAVPDELQFEQEDEYERVVTRAHHKFVYGASDDHGHSVQVNVRHQPTMAARVKAVAEHPATPYKSTSAVWRDAMYWYLRFMEQWLQDGDFSEEMKMAILQSETDHHVSLTEQRTTLVKSSANAIQALIETRDISRLPDMISSGQQIVAQSTVDTSELERAIDDARRVLERHQ